MAPHHLYQITGTLPKTLKCSGGPSIDNRPTKRVKIEKGSLFDLLPAEILSIIDDWSISFEYNYKHITFMNRIIQKNPVLRNLPCNKLKPFHNFIPLSIYSTIRYKWLHRHYKKHRIGYVPKTHFTKNTHLTPSLFNYNTNST